MMKKITYIISFVAVIFLASCEFEKEIDTDDLQINPHLVLNSLIIANSDTTLFNITESRAIYRPADSLWGLGSFPKVPNAKINLLINNVTQSTVFNEKLGYYFLNKIKPEDEISVEITQNNRTIKASTIIPKAPEVISVDTATVYKMYNGYTMRFIQYKVKIKDQPKQKNYFRLLVSSYIKFYPKTDVPFLTEYVNPFFSYITDDPVLTNGILSTPAENEFGFISFPKNYLSIFADNLFVDKEHTLVFYVEYDDTYFFPKEDIESWNSIIKLQTISEELYNYYFSVQRYTHLQENDMVEPSVIYSNIKGGLGILGACNEVKASEISIPLNK